MGQFKSLDGQNSGFENKRAVILGGSGAIGSAVAMTLARRGAEIHLGGRSVASVENSAKCIRDAGGTVFAFQADVLDPDELDRKARQLAEDHGPVDIVLNATGFMHDQGKEIAEISAKEFLHDVEIFLAAAFNVAKAFTPHMGGDRPGVIVSVVAPASKMAIPGHVSHIVACAGVEAFSKALAAELGPRNIRSVCLRTHAIVDAIDAGSYTLNLFEPKAKALGLTVPEWLEAAAQTTMTKRLPTLAQVAETITFIASEHSAAMTGTIVNMTAGAIVD
ncbi:SDR family oxidoreductase [uncultured Parasphingorhabdus sp.]|uniref:SDR family NAD(P)-dependent oxidoreductase n=1 Tax=uncultured Parasphingorhabdus sp. TaxID=2709694 RepID=UPI0030DB1904|tara:strand:- start:34665 stop:35495 length:831 start_codon:yes stop_codon:yes gene_type:complete